MACKTYMDSDSMRKILRTAETVTESESARKLTRKMQEQQTDVCVIGAGISGLATAKCLREAGFDVVVYERTGEVGGLWVFRENDYGVMRFTHINVSKQNYCFMIFKTDETLHDFPHNTQMAQYIGDYTRHFNISECIRYHRRVTKLERDGEGWRISSFAVEDDGKGGEKLGQEEILVAKFVAIATGHHAKPSWPKFAGQDSFKGEIIHSVAYKDAITNGMVGKRALIVGIGNSAVDAAVDLATVGRCKKVHLSTRSGAWIVPNYLFGRPIDHYSCRLVLKMPLTIMNFVFETLVSLIHGHPNMYGLNPKMKILQTQPTVSPVLLNHLQRKHIIVHPNISKMEEKRVTFADGTSVEVDSVVFCTGYHIDLPFLSNDTRSKVTEDGNNILKLYKNVFSPSVGPSLAFIGFVQPASGGVISMSEIQARWFAELCKKKVKLPQEAEMRQDIKTEEEESKKRYHKSARHTIQKDPILYCDSIAQKFGAQPDLWRYPTLAWRLLFGTCGPAQYRLQGPNKWSDAASEVRKVSVTGLAHYSVLAVLGLIFALLVWLITVIVY
nr:flavin-containing monooxygenase 5-like [Lytechinus pictus]